MRRSNENHQGVARKALRALGYECISTSEPMVAFSNFVNLTQAYEKRLAELNHRLPKNDVRPRLLARLLGTPPSEAYFIVHALAQCNEVDGDVCEFGVAQGETSALIANEIMRQTDKVLHLFDSFEGLPKPSEKDQLKNDIFALSNIEAYAGKMSCAEDMVRVRLKAISFPAKRYIIHKGFIEGLLRMDEDLPKKVSFAYVDFDFYEPTRTALQFLHGIASQGSIIIVDDYDFFSTGSKTAVDEFITEKNATGELYECFVPSTCYGHFAVLTRLTTDELL